MLKTIQFKKIIQIGLQLKNLKRNINQTPTNVKKYARKYGNRAHVKTQPNYRNLGNNNTVKAQPTYYPKMALVHVSTSNFQKITLMLPEMYLNIYEGSSF